jgi:excisionase family DNA binding protein
LLKLLLQGAANGQSGQAVSLKSRRKAISGPFNGPSTVSPATFPPRTKVDERKSPMLTVGEAAELCGVSRSTISHAIRTGSLSATRREDGSWSIDNAELARYLDAYLDAHGYRSRSKTGDADHQLLEKLRLVHGEPRFDIAPELRRARSPASNT